MTILRKLALASVLFGLTATLYQGALGNFVVARFHASAAQFGLLTSLGELPGLLSVLMFLVLGRYSSAVALTLACLAAGIGALGTGLAPTFGLVVASSCVVSVGTHVWGPTTAKVVLGATAGNRRASGLGAMLSWGSAAGMAGLAALAWLAGSVSLRAVVGLSGVFALAASVLFLVTRDPDLVGRAQTAPRPALDRRCLPYYAIASLSAMREMVVYTFATFMLLDTFHASLATMAVLLFVRLGLSVVLRPVFGRLIDRAGAQRSLAISYVVLAGLFVGYVLVQSAAVAYGLFVLDWSLTNVDDVALTVVAQDVAPEGTILQTLATGDTLAHVGAMAVPILGGLVWKADGRATLFGLCAVMAAMTAVIAFRVRLAPAQGAALPAMSD